MSIFKEPQDYDYVWKPPVKLPSNLIRLALSRQGTTWTCGAAAVQSLIRFYGIEFDMREDSLVEQLGSNEDVGTNIARIQTFLTGKGWNVTIRDHLTAQDVKNSIDKKDPMLVCFQAWVEKTDLLEKDFTSRWEDGHYAIICGYDQQHFFFMDPSTLGQYTFIPIEEFMARWHDVDGENEQTGAKLLQWGLTVSREDREKDFDSANYAFYLS